MDAAIQVFAEQGFYQATISQIARKAKVADGTIYLYFKNKDDILSNVFSHTAQKVFFGFRKAVDAAGTAEDKLKALIRCHLKEFQRDRHMAIVYLAETHKNYRKADTQIREMAKFYYDLVAEIVELGQVEGLLRKDLYMGLVKRIIIGSVDEVISTWLHADASYDLSSMADPLVELLIRGFGADPTALGNTSELDSKS